jgi:hypothetical protein
LLTSSSRGALAFSSIGPGDDKWLDPESEDIVITGRRITTDIGDFWEGTGDGGSTGSGGGDAGGGGGGGGTLAAPVAQHDQDCGTDDGAAVQIAKHVLGTLPPGVAGPPDPLTTSSGKDWTQVEFGAHIVQNLDGSFGAYSNTIYSNDSPKHVFISYSSSLPLQGFWQSHPGGDSTGLQLIARYPSPDDWLELGKIAGYSDPSLWITGPDGVTREFKWSERDYFKTLNDNQSRMEKGEGLEGRERTQSCG